MRFVDTNILLYAISRDTEEQAKRERANAILRERDLGLSVQVLQEFYVQATRSSRADAITHDQAVKPVEAFLRFRTLDITSALMRAAFATHDRFGISYWDAMIIEAARALRCEVVLSGDLSDEQDYAGVRIENPFNA
ncbi:MAG: PIN domain-containing protein [Solirubrobacteraceae bacterium]